MGIKPPHSVFLTFSLDSCKEEQKNFRLNILTWLDMLHSSREINYLLWSALFLTYKQPISHLADVILQAVHIVYMTMKT